MKRVSLSLFYGMLAAGAVFWLAAPSARATKSFKAGFEAHYLQPNEKDSKQAAQRKALLAKAVGEAKCNVCHHGKDKKIRNAYGAELSKLLDKKADGKNTKKVLEALEKVAKMKCDPKDDKSPTFGELIGQGKLPVEPPAEK